MSNFCFVFEDFARMIRSVGQLSSFLIFVWVRSTPLFRICLFHADPVPI
jgi:hypothetical protein